MKRDETDEIRSFDPDWYGSSTPEQHEIIKNIGGGRFSSVVGVPKVKKDKKQPLPVAHDLSLSVHQYPRATDKLNPPPDEAPDYRTKDFKYENPPYKLFAHLRQSRVCPLYFDDIDDRSKFTKPHAFKAAYSYVFGGRNVLSLVGLYSLFYEPSAITKFVHSPVERPGIVRMPQWSPAIFHRRRTSKLKSERWKDSVRRQEGLEDLREIRKDAERFLREKLGLPDSFSFRVSTQESRLRWFPTRDGDPDSDSWQTLMWSEIIKDEIQESLNACEGVSSEFWKKWEKKHEIGGLEDNGLTYSLASFALQLPPIGVGRLSGDGFTDDGDALIARTTSTLPYRLEYRNRFYSIFRLSTFFFGFHPKDGVTFSKVDRLLLNTVNWTALTVGLLPIVISLLLRSAKIMSCEPMAHYTNSILATTLIYPNASDCALYAFLWVVLFITAGTRSERTVLQHDEGVGHTSAAAAITAALKSSFAPLWLVAEPLGDAWKRQIRCEKRDASRRAASPPNFQGSVSCRGRGAFADSRFPSLAKFTFVASVGTASFFSSSPFFLPNMVSVIYITVGLSLAVCVQQHETGLLPREYNVATLSHTSLSCDILMSTLLGQIVGGSGGIFFVVDFALLFALQVVGGTTIVGGGSDSTIGCWIKCVFLSALSYLIFQYVKVLITYNIAKARQAQTLRLFNKLVFFMLPVFVVLGLMASQWRPAHQQLLLDHHFGDPATGVSGRWLSGGRKPLSQYNWREFLS